MSLYFFYYNFPKHFFFLKYKEISVIFFCNPNDVEVSKTYIRYDTLPRLKMVIEWIQGSAFPLYLVKINNQQWMR